MSVIAIIMRIVKDKQYNAITSRLQPSNLLMNGREGIFHYRNRGRYTPHGNNVLLRQISNVIVVYNNKKEIDAVIMT